MKFSSNYLVTLFDYVLARGWINRARLSNMPSSKIFWRRQRKQYAESIKRDYFFERHCQSWASLTDG